MAHYNIDWYQTLSEGHELVTLDLKSSKERARLDELLQETDLLITANRPVALTRLSLGWTELNRKFPRLCQVAIVGYPAPRDNEAGHDLTYQASLGLLNPPHMPRTLLADMAGAEQAVCMSLALLLARERGLESGYAQVALSEAAAAMAEPLRFNMTVPGALLGGGVPEYNIYQTRDNWVAVAALEPHFKKRLEEELGNGIKTVDQYRAVFKTDTAANWQEWGQKLDIPIVSCKGTVVQTD
jgi:crotonobetainyl-CoA:carnitine CoA-transferase CaiB-like acyl-CoA transferase